MFGKQLWIPTFSLLDTWKAVLSILTETLLSQVPKRFANSRNFHSKSGKIYRKKISENLGFFKLFLWSRRMLFWKNLSKMSLKFLKKSKCIFLQENVTFILKKVPSTKQNFILEKHPSIQKTSLKERARGKTAAARWSSSLSYQNGFFVHIYDMKGNLPLPLAFFTYTSQLHVFLQTIKD